MSIHIWLVHTIAYHMLSNVEKEKLVIDLGQPESKQNQNLFLFPTGLEITDIQD
jgi:hypothetical protein